MNQEILLQVLLVEDDAENLELLMQTLPDTLEGVRLQWHPCADFDEAKTWVNGQRYDIIVADIYRDRSSPQKDPVTGDPRALDSIVEHVRGHRFTPVLLFTDGTFPTDEIETPFLKMADKTQGNSQIVAKLSELIGTGIPRLAHLLHEELDRSAGSYLWSFLEAKWPSLSSAGLTAPSVLERLLRRRAAIQLGRLDAVATAVTELETVEGAEFYLYPSIAGGELRLGEIIRRRNGDREYRVVLTPHCHLTLQPNAQAPKAEFVLTARTVEARDLFGREPVPGNSEDRRLRNLPARLQSPAELGIPRGRFWFLPGFLDMPHLYVDLLQLESLPFDVLGEVFESFAVLDTPFAEALQSCFLRLYSAVGLPLLVAERFRDLLG